MRAESTPTIRTLNRQWSALADSRRLHRRIEQWHAQVPAIPAVSPDELVARVAVRSPTAARACPALDALVGLAYSDPLALQVAMRAMLPRWISLIESVRPPGATRDEVASLVVSIGTEALLDVRLRTAPTPTDYLLWSRTRQRVRRCLAREFPRAEQAVDPTDEHLDRLDAHQPIEDPGTVADLAAWVSTRAGVPTATGRLVAETRSGEVTLAAFASAAGCTYDTAARRRSRAEDRLRAALAAA